MLAVPAAYRSEVRVVAQSLEQPAQSQQEDGSEDAALLPYRRDMERRIKRAWFPPLDGKGVTVKFMLKEDGSVDQVRISKSSGLAEGDQAAIKAVQMAAPFRRLPGGEHGSRRAVCAFGFDPTWRHPVSVSFLERESEVGRDK